MGRRGPSGRVLRGLAVAVGLRRGRAHRARGRGRRHVDGAHRGRRIGPGRARAAPRVVARRSRKAPLDSSRDGDRSEAPHLPPSDRFREGRHPAAAPHDPDRNGRARAADDRRRAFRRRQHGLHDREHARELGPLAEPVAAGLRPRLLCHRDDGDRRADARHGAIRRRGLPLEPPSGGRDDRRRPGHPQHGAAATRLPVIESDEGLETEELILNMGPQHPSTHGVLRLVLKLQGEKVIECIPVMGYLHRGLEKIFEWRTFHQGIRYADQADYVSNMLNEHAYAGAMEAIGGIDVPRRAEYVRVIVDEMSRCASHLIWLGTYALDLGATTPILFCLRDREEILDMFEEICGSRMNFNYYRPGCVLYDFPPVLLAKLKRFLDPFAYPI